jgi:hypothetical protein
MQIGIGTYLVIFKLFIIFSFEYPKFIMCHWIIFLDFAK